MKLLWVIAAKGCRITQWGFCACKWEQAIIAFVVATLNYERRKGS